MIVKVKVMTAIHSLLSWDRKVIRLGRSKGTADPPLYVNLPKEYCQALTIAEGDMARIGLDKLGNLIITVSKESQHGEH